MIKLSVVIITFNEEQNIERCIRSVMDIADEIVILDSVSTDKTKEICLGFPVRFLEQPFLGYIEQKNKALEFAQFPYVLSLDADEALSEHLKDSIREVKNDWKKDGYAFNRLTNYCGKWIRHTDWYPDRKLRLFDKRKGQWSGINPHDKFELQDGSTLAILKGDLLHYSFPSIQHHLNVLNRFTRITAKESFEKGKRAGMVNLLFSPFWKFIKSYFIRLGILDGYYGFVVCAISSFATFMKYVQMKELQKKHIEN
jgi:glycosyltransferase involved in cell wall biosynthesis